MYNNYNNPYYNPNYNIQPTTNPINNYQQQNRLDNQYLHQAVNNYQNPIQGLQGKQVESIDIVRSIEIPLDGSVSYFPVADGTTIVTKQLQNDGTTKIKIFKESENEQENTEYVTRNELNEMLSKEKEQLKIMFKNLNLDDIEDDIKDIKKQLKKKGEQA